MLLWPKATPVTSKHTLLWQVTNKDLSHAYHCSTPDIFIGIWTSTVFLGNFLGSTLGGVLVHAYGFPTTATGSVSFFTNMHWATLKSQFFCRFFILYFIFFGVDVMELGFCMSFPPKNQQYHLASTELEGEN